MKNSYLPALRVGADAAGGRAGHVRAAHRVAGRPQLAWSHEREAHARTRGGVHMCHALTQAARSGYPHEARMMAGRVAQARHTLAACAQGMHWRG